MRYILFLWNYIFSDICGVSGSLAFNPAAVLNDGDALVKCQQNAIKVTFYVKVISTEKQMEHETS